MTTSIAELRLKLSFMAEHLMALTEDYIALQKMLAALDIDEEAAEQKRKHDYMMEIFAYQMQPVATEAPKKPIRLPPEMIWN